MRLKNNKEIIENTITAVYLAAGHKIQDSALLKNNKKKN